MKIREISNQEDIIKSYNVLSQIYENLEPQNYVNNITEMQKQGYLMAGVFEDDESCIGVIGANTVFRINFGKTFEIQDFMIHRAKRKIGVGKMLLNWANWQAMTCKCQNITTNLQTARKESQAIFMREKFTIDGFSFIKKC